jgi:hypothetical protein
MKTNDSFARALEINQRIDLTLIRDPVVKTLNEDIAAMIFLRTWRLPRAANVDDMVWKWYWSLIFRDLHERSS